MPSTPAIAFVGIMPAPFGRIGIRCSEKAIDEIVFLGPETPLLSPGNSLCATAARQIGQYLSDPDFRFTLPLSEKGSSFRRQVWAAISAIPLGHTATYGDIANHLGNSPRAVGQACGDNPFPLVIPCHRVTGSHGIGGFANDRGGFLLEIKHWLLRHEGVLPPRLPGF